MDNQRPLIRRDGYLIHPSPYVDSRLAPVYILNIQNEVFAHSVEPLHAHIAAALRFYAALDHPYAYVTVLSQLRELQPTSRKLYAQHVNEIEPYALKYCCARAVVCDNAVQRGFATAVLWFLRSRIESRFFTDMSEAVAWARAFVALARPRGHAEL